MQTHAGEGGKRECVPEVIIFLFARLVLAWERRLISANESSSQGPNNNMAWEKGLGFRV